MDTRTDKRQSRREQEEGSRENGDLGTPNPAESGGDAGAPMERGAGQISHPEKPLEPAQKRGQAGASKG